MNFAVLLLLVGLMGTACVDSACPKKCTNGSRAEHLPFKHVSQLGSSSVAPWDLAPNTEAERFPEILDYAVCKPCRVKNMTAKTIFFEVSVYRRVATNSSESWCVCPYKLAVGCTCVA